MSRWMGEPVRLGFPIHLTHTATTVSQKTTAGTRMESPHPGAIPLTHTNDGNSAQFLIVVTISFFYAFIISNVCYDKLIFWTIVFILVIYNYHLGFMLIESKPVSKYWLAIGLILRSYFNFELFSLSLFLFM